MQRTAGNAAVACMLTRADAPIRLVGPDVPVDAPATSPREDADAIQPALGPTRVESPERAVMPAVGRPPKRLSQRLTPAVVVALQRTAPVGESRNEFLDAQRLTLVTGDARCISGAADRWPSMPTMRSRAARLRCEREQWSLGCRLGTDGPARSRALIRMRLR